MSFADRYQQVLRGEWTFSADGTKVVGPIEGGGVIKNVRVFNASTLATHATDYVTFKLINMGTNAAGTTVIATASTSQTGGSAMAANVAFPLTITAAAATVADNEVLGLIYDEATTTVADNHAITVVVHYIPTGV